MNVPIRNETELYLPVKSFLEQQGYDVRSEVKSCDILALSRTTGETVIVELKKTFNLSLIFQGIDRLKIATRVYLAVEKTKKKAGSHNQRWGDIANLCRLLGLGLITVQFYKTKKPFIEVLNESSASAPLRSQKRITRMLDEFNGRSGDYNEGGSYGRKLVTVYREKALLCAHYLSLHGSLSPRQLKIHTGSSTVSDILVKNSYGWFIRTERGIYTLSTKGHEALDTYAHVLRAYIPVEPIV